MNKVYLIAVNMDSTFDATAFRNHISSLYPAKIGAWWHYIQGSVYFVESSLNASGVYNLMYPAIPGRQFIVMEVDPKNQQGWLNNEAWAWFKKYRKQTKTK